MTPFHSVVPYLGPGWIRRRQLFTVTWAIFVIVDVLVDMTVQAIRRTFPGAVGCLPDGILQLADEMGLRKGPSEEIEAFATRLSLAHDAIARKGNTLELLRQIRAYFQAWGVFPIDFVDPFGRRTRLEVDNTIIKDSIAPDALSLSLGLITRCRVYMYSGTRVPVSENDVYQLLDDWVAGHVRLAGSVVHAGSRVWNEPELLWNLEGETWNVDAPIVVEVNT